MNFKCAECPGWLLRILGEKKQHKNYHKALIKEQDTVKEAEICDRKAGGGQQGSAGDSQDDVIGGQEAVVVGQEPGVDGQEPGDGQEPVLAGQGTGVGRGIVDQVFGWEGSENYQIQLKLD